MKEEFYENHIDTYDPEGRFNMSREEANGYEVYRGKYSARGGAEIVEVDEFSDDFIEKCFDEYWDEKRGNQSPQAP